MRFENVDIDKNFLKRFDRVKRIQKLNIIDQHKESITQRIRLVLTLNRSLPNFHILERNWHLFRINNQYKRHIL